MDKKYLWLVLPIIAALLAVPVTADDVTVTANVPVFVSVVFNYNTVSFGVVTPGSTDVPAPGTYEGIYNVTVTSNVYLDVHASRTLWSPLEGYLTLKFGTHFISGELSPSIILETSDQLVGTVEPGSFTHYHGYWLTVPLNAPAGSYSTTVTITYAVA
jgi:hypothetical protein